MINVSINGSSIARSAAILVALLFAPLTVSAADSAAHTLSHTRHGGTNDHHAGNISVAIQRHDSPAETPLHCHLKSPLPLAKGLSQAQSGSNQQLVLLIFKSPSARENGMHLSAVSAQTPVVALPRFILFGNFRS